MTMREDAIKNASILAQKIFVTTVDGSIGSTTYYAERNGEITYDYHIGPYERESVYYDWPGHAAPLSDIGSDGYACGLPAYEIYAMDDKADPQPNRQGRFYGDYDAETESYWDGECWMKLTDTILYWQDVENEDPSEVLARKINELEHGFFHDEK